MTNSTELILFLYVLFLISYLFLQLSIDHTQGVGVESLDDAKGLHTAPLTSLFNIVSVDNGWCVVIVGCFDGFYFYELDVAIDGK